MVVYPSGKTYPPSGGGLTWEEIKQKLESEGAKNKAYDSDVDGVIDVEAIPKIALPFKIFDDFGDNALTSRDRTFFQVNDPTFPQTGLAADSTGIKYTSSFRIPIFVPSLIRVRATWTASHTDSVTRIELIDDAENVIVSVSGNTGDNVASVWARFAGNLRVQVRVTTASGTSGATTDVISVAVEIKSAVFHFADNFRPEWSIVSGSPTVSDGRLYLDNDCELQTQSNFTEGAWQFDFEWTESGSNYTSSCRIRFMCKDSDNYYYIHLDAILDSDWNGFRKCVGGNITNLLAFSINLGTHTIKVTRDSNGNFEVFYDGVSKGTVTDTDITESNYFSIWYNQYDYGKLYLDNLEVY